MADSPEGREAPSADDERLPLPSLPGRLREDAGEKGAPSTACDDSEAALPDRNGGARIPGGASAHPPNSSRGRNSPSTTTGAAVYALHSNGSHSHSQSQSRSHSHSQSQSQSHSHGGAAATSSRSAPPPLGAPLGRLRPPEEALDCAGADSDLRDGRKKKRNQPYLGADKAGKGLRHFSVKVCEKVKSKGRTTYNEVADELVAEFSNPEITEPLHKHRQQQYDEKNIRRRVYDALNVLMAMDIIAKEKKEIRWRGLPTVVASSTEHFQAEGLLLRARLDKKESHLKELEEQISGIERLVERNQAACRLRSGGGGGGGGGGVALPFIIVQTRPQATVEVMISEDMQVVHFDFNSTPFQLHDDSYVLRAMGLFHPPAGGAALRQEGEAGGRSPDSVPPP